MMRSGFDRRLDGERRVAHDLNYFENGGTERRRKRERRRAHEKREGWVRVSGWSSVAVGEWRSELFKVAEKNGVPTYEIR